MPALALEHTVEPGESLWSLARRFGVSVAALESANKLPPESKLRSGQKLLVPNGKPSSKPAGDATTSKSAKSAPPKPEPVKPESVKPEPAKSALAAKSGKPGSSAGSKGAKQPETASNKPAPAEKDLAKPAAKAPSTLATRMETRVVSAKGGSASPQDPSPSPRSTPNPQTSTKAGIASAGIASKNITPAAADKRAPAGAADKRAPEVTSPTPSRPSPDTRSVATQEAPRPAPAPLRPLNAETRERAERLYQEGSTPVAANTLDEVAPDWVLRKPDASTQGEKPNSARGGVYPCAAPDAGFGNYQKWVQVGPLAHVLSPKAPQLDADGGFDLVIHFHGREPIRKEWVRMMQNTVLVAVDVGIDSESYRIAFRDPRSIGQIVHAAELEVAKRAGVAAAHARRIGLSAWSAGYGAVESILSQPFGATRVDSLMLLDGLHSGYGPRSLDTQRLQPFVDFAQRAARNERFMFVSHSSLRTQGYASTTETANYLAWKLGGRPQSAIAASGYPMGLERISSFNAGDFHLRGFKGSGVADHCAHIGLMRDVLRVYLVGRYEKVSPQPAAPAAPPLPVPPPSNPDKPRALPDSPLAWAENRH